MSSVGSVNAVNGSQECDSRHVRAKEADSTKVRARKDVEYWLEVVMGAIFEAQKELVSASKADAPTQARHYICNACTAVRDARGLLEIALRQVHAALSPPGEIDEETWKKTFANDLAQEESRLADVQCNAKSTMIICMPSAPSGTRTLVTASVLLGSRRAEIDFVPYTYKDIKDVDLMEYSALRHFGMLPYITLMERHCVPSDVFYWGIFNTNATDERLLITGPDGRSNVIGWKEVMTAFGGDHSAKDEFGGTKITRSQLLPYKPADFLPETVLDVSEELGSGKDSEEVIYYREAVLYGPTYYFGPYFRDN
ncbi:hypothetical protein R1sor_003237 [Riccia sorocarpa]|uniref:Uncharacterized protein n=1 Tax=Riccia sorocarpa TaxID=122646 RepID=A0ABD3H103_9MARC